MFNGNSHRAALVSQAFTKTKKQASFESHQSKRLTFQAGSKFRIFYVQTLQHLSDVQNSECRVCPILIENTRSFAHDRVTDLKPPGWSKVNYHTVWHYKLESENNCTIIFAKVHGSQGQIESYHFWRTVDYWCYGKRKNPEIPIFFFLYLLHPSCLH